MSPEVAIQLHFNGEGLSLKFNGSGYLDPGFHNASLEDIEKHLVSAFPSSTTRQAIMDGYKRHRSDLTAMGLAVEQFIDGSFVSTKNDPGDVDLVCLIDLDVVDALDPAVRPQFEALVSGQVTKGTHSCDSYFCPTVPDTHPLYSKLRAQRKYWMGEFGFDRVDTPKGIVLTSFAPAAETETP